MSSTGARLVLAGLAAACLALAGPAAASAAPRTVWLCRPGARPDPCVGDLSATRITSSGQHVERTPIDRRAPIDCFYVYPTVSDQPTVTATLHVDPQERAIASFQASRFSSVCRVWAPMYRQVTLSAIADPSRVTAAANALGYADVRAAWRAYLARYNRGRGVVLIGHSQGSFVLRRLIAKEIDRHPAVRRRLVSAILPGGNVTVRKGGDAGGDFRHVRACRAASQTGCVVAYSAFGETPPPGSLFGRVAGAARLQVLCTNPSALGGGTGTLKPYVRTTPFPGTLGQATSLFVGPLPAVSTPWLKPPGRYSARCESAAGASFLRVDAHDGARSLPAVPDATWGLHLGDLNLALGNLTALVRRQAAAYARVHWARRGAAGPAR